MLFQIFHDVRINYTLCFIGKSIFCSYYFSVFILSACKGNIFFLHVQEYDEVFWKKIGVWVGFLAEFSALWAR